MSNLSPQGAGGPRYRKLTQQQVDEAIAYSKTGAMNDDIAAMMGVSRSSLYRYLADGRNESERRYVGHDPDPDLDLSCDLWDGINKAHGEIVALLAGSWLRAAQNDWRAAEALLTKRFTHWRPTGIGAGAEGAGNAHDAADVAETKLTDAQANALVGAMRRFGDLLLEAVVVAGSGSTQADVDTARAQMGTFARAALEG